MESEQLIKGKAPLRAVITRKEDTASVDETIKEIELYRYLHAAPDIGNFVLRIKSLLLKIGITDFSHNLLERISGGLDPCGTYDPAITDEYAKEGFHLGDLATRHLLINSTPIFRSTVCEYVEAAPFDNDLFRQHREVTKFMAKHGLLDVYNVPITFENYRASFSMSSHMCPSEKLQENIKKNLHFIHQLAILVDNVGRKKFNKYLHSKNGNHRLPVRPRSLKLLETLANKDLTLNEAAEVLNISISTANQHIAAAKKSLNSHTLHGAILAADREGLILLER